MARDPGRMAGSVQDPGQMARDSARTAKSVQDPGDPSILASSRPNSRRSSLSDQYRRNLAQYRWNPAMAAECRPIRARTGVGI
jgi:hypothetical protein